ncbi:MAG: hypothetical protein R2726_02860 [Acidimicrobiales bacterium]
MDPADRDGPDAVTVSATSPDPDRRDELAELRSLVALQQRQIDELRDRLDDVVAAAAARPAVHATADPTGATHHVAPDAAPQPDHRGAPDDIGPPDRRAFIRRAGTAAAGAVAATTAGAAIAAGPAAAANGDPIGPGLVTSGTSPATLWYTGASTPPGGGSILVVGDTSLAPAGGGPVAIFGWAARTTTTGVYGLSSAVGGVGVRGNVNASGAGIGLQGRGRSAALWLEPVAGNGPPAGRSTAGVAGMLDADDNGDVWACVATGTPGTWRKVAGPTSAGSLHVLDSTTRVYDSRPGNPPLGGIKTPLANNGQRTVDCKVGGAVPLGATAALVNVTVVNTSASGFLALFKGGIAWPGNSTINWNAPNTIIANSAVVALDSLAQLTARCSGSASTDFFVDVVGYYR